MVIHRKHEPTKNSASRILFYNNHPNKQSANDDYRITTGSSSRNIEKINNTEIQLDLDRNVNSDSFGFYNYSNTMRAHLFMQVFLVFCAFYFIEI